MPHNLAFSVEQLAGSEFLIRYGLSLSQGDKLVVLCQNELRRVAECICQAAKNAKVQADLRLFDLTDFPRGFSVTDLSTPTIPAGIVLLIEWSESSSRERLELVRTLGAVHKGWRIASMPGVDLEGLALCVCDFAEIKRLCDMVFAVFARSKMALVETINPNGGKDLLEIPIGLFRPQNSTGQIARNSWGNFPSGETFIVPNPYQANGWITIRGSLPNRPLMPREWIRVQLSEGRLAHDSIDGTSSELIQHFIKLFYRTAGIRKDENSDALAELGVGTNSHIPQLTGNPIFDEKKLGAIHISFGSNDQFKGPLSSAVRHGIVCDDASLLLQAHAADSHVGVVRLITEGIILVTPELALPALDRFNAADCPNTVALGMVDYTFERKQCGATKTTELLIEYESERDNIRYAIASDRVAELAQLVLANIAVCDSLPVDQLMENIKNADEKLCKQIIQGLVVYGVLDDAEKNAAE